MARAQAGDSRASWAQAADDQAADMYLDGLALADSAGYHQYEISNVRETGPRKPPQSQVLAERRLARIWLWSTFDGRRASLANVSGTADYVDRLGRGATVRIDVAPLSPTPGSRRRCLPGCDCREGLDRAELSGTLRCRPLAEVWTTLQPYVDDGLMWLAGDRFGLTRRGMLVANSILAEFV